MALTRLIQRILRQNGTPTAGLPNIHFHDLRRTDANILIACGVSHKVVQERLGHKNISTTLALYAQGTELGHIDASNASLQFLKQGQTKDEIDSSDKAN